MKLISKTKENGFLRIEVQFDGLIWESTIDKEIKRAKSKLEVPGFRAGKVPDNIAQKYVRMPSIYDLTGKKLVEDNWEAIIKHIEDEKIISDIQDIKINATGKSGSALLTFMLFPEVKLPDFKALKVKRDDVKVSQKDIDREYERFAQHFKKQRYVFEKTLAKGDVAVIDFEGFIDGKAFEGGSGDNFDLTLGSNQFIPGFEEQLIGKKTGETIDVNVKFPDDYHADEYAGKPALFKVAIKSVKVFEELSKEETEERLKMFNIKDFDEAKKQIESAIASDKQAQANEIFVKKLMIAIDNDPKCKIETPEALIKQEIKLLIKQTENQMERQGQKMADYMKAQKLTQDKLEEQFREPAIERIKSTLLISQVAEDNKIVVSEKELDEKINELAKENNATPEMVRQYMKVDNIEYGLREKKVLDYLASLAK